MAYINVADWTPEHVAEWLKGLETSLLPYVQFFMNNHITGFHLLHLTSDDLEQLHIFKIGHQLLIFEAVDLLRQLHYTLNSETLQSLLVKLACKSRNLYNDLKLNGPAEFSSNVRQERISTCVLFAVSEILTSVKVLVSWLDRHPFQQDAVCSKLKKNILKLSIELASTTQRDQFAERPHSLIKRNSLQLAELSDNFVQNSKDSLMLHPASLDIAMIKKKQDEELGIHIKSTYSGVHIVGGIKDQGPAKACNKIERGDEIVQVNYQTVIGWQQKKLVTAMTELGSELHLTLKKRPRHINLLGEVIILRPYRIPAKKTINKSLNWQEDNHSTRSDATCSTSNESECPRDGNDFLKEIPFQYRLRPEPAAATVKRRATISGASPTILKPPVNIEDLVMGIKYLKTDAFGRSLSHDPSWGMINTFTRSEIIFKDFESQNNSELSDFDEHQDAVSSEILSVVINQRKDDAQNNSNIIFNHNTLNQNKNTSPNQTFSQEKRIVEELEKILDGGIGENANKSFTKTLLNTCDEESSSNADITIHTNNDKNEYRNINSEVSEFKYDIHCAVNKLDGCKYLDVPFTRPSQLDSTPDMQSEDSMKYEALFCTDISERSISEMVDKKIKHEVLDSKFEFKPKEKLSTGRCSTRNVTYEELGKGHFEGWLRHYREKNGILLSNQCWKKRWIVLKDNFLYCYRDQSDEKARCLICLPGCKVSPVYTPNSKNYIFEIQKNQTTFYFASASHTEIENWILKITLASTSYDVPSDFIYNKVSMPDVILNIGNNFYSETDDSESSSPSCNRHMFQIKNCTSAQHAYISHNLQDKDSRHKVDDFYEKNINSSNKTENNNEAGHHCNGNVSILKQNHSSSFPSCHQDKPVIKYDCPKIHTKCNRSFSYSDTSQHVENERLSSKLNYRSYTNRNIYCNEQKQNKLTTIGNPRSFMRNSFQKDDTHTASLERQHRPSAKEITPGLVARMAVSYSNLSQNNSNSPSVLKKTHIKRGIPAPGYVAKISDSFDLLAKMAKTEINKSEVNKVQQISNGGIYENLFYNCARSASESQVGGSMLNFLHAGNREADSKLSKNSLSSKHFNDNHQCEKSKPQKYISLLDKEYNKVFEGKKVSHLQLKSPNSHSVTECEFDRRKMRFFPCDMSSPSPTTDVFENSVSSTNISKHQSSNVETQNESFVAKEDSSPHSDYGYQKSFSYSAVSHLSDNTFSYSEGIENVGFYCPDHASDDSVSSISSKDTDIVRKTKLSLPHSASDSINKKSETMQPELESPKLSFKFFSSHKFMQKLSSPKLDKKNIFKSKKHAKELKKAEQQNADTSERKLFGSPILGRAFFRSPKTDKKIKKVSSGVQTDINFLSDFITNSVIHDLNRNESILINKTCNKQEKVSKFLDEINVSESSSGSLESGSPNHVTPNILTSFTDSNTDNKLEPQIVSSLPSTPTKRADTRISPSDMSRMPLRPMMGISMISKKRLPSISGESSISILSSKSSNEDFTKESSHFSEGSEEILGNESTEQSETHDDDNIMGLFISHSEIEKI